MKMRRTCNIHRIIPGERRGFFLMPEAKVYLNPTERTLYRLFLNHPEGISATNLLAHWKELCSIYRDESIYSDDPLRDDAMESLCAESKTVFYSTISRIKKKFIQALGARNAAPYIIKRDKTGLYRTRARL